MSIAIWFWILYVIAIVFHGWRGYVSTPTERWGWGGALLFFVLVGLLGWGAFGSPISGR